MRSTILEMLAFENKNRKQFSNDNASTNIGLINKSTVLLSVYNLGKHFIWLNFVDIILPKNVVRKLCCKANFRKEDPIKYVTRNAIAVSDNFETSRHVYLGEKENFIKCRFARVKNVTLVKIFPSSARLF